MTRQSGRHPHPPIWGAHSLMDTEQKGDNSLRRDTVLLSGSFESIQRDCGGPGCGDRIHILVLPLTGRLTLGKSLCPQPRVYYL